MSVFLLSIGDEILDGRIQNSNATWFGEQLRLAGVPVTEVRAVSDKITDIAAALKDAGKRATLVIATGGLGPTNDDRTVQGAAKAFHRKVARNKIAEKQVKARYVARNLPVTPERLRMADMPAGAKPLKNETGAAPGILLKHKHTEYFFLPGPPSECRPIFTRDILPRAKKLAPEKIIRREFWRTFGRGESDVFQTIAPEVSALEKKYPRTFRFGVHISFPCVDLTLEIIKMGAAKRPSAKEISQLVETITERTREICFTRERETMIDAIFRLLRDHKKTLAVAESCTGGLVSKLITDIPGSSAVFLGGVITYANSAKEILAQVPRAAIAAEGAVSETVVKAMAENTRKKLGADYGIALSGVSGPDGGSERKPVGTIWVALSSASGTKTLHQVILNGRGSRDQNRTIATYLALNALRAEILVSHGTGNQLS